MKFVQGRNPRTAICAECGNESFALFIAENYISAKCLRCGGVKTMIEDEKEANKK